MKASVEELDVFAARVLGAKTLRDVFNPAPTSRSSAASPARPTAKARKKKR